MKVLFMTNIPSPYRADFFNEFGKLCDLTVTYEGLRSIERDKKWVGAAAKYYTPVFLKGQRTRTDQFLCFGIIRVIKQRWDAIIIGNYSSPTSMLAIEYLKIHRIPYIVQADGGLIKTNENRWKYMLKRRYIGSASAWISSGDATTKYLAYYGANIEKCFKYPFTSLWKADLEKANHLKKSNINILRQKLGMTEKYIVLTVGRFSYDAGYGKGYDLLLKAAEKLSSEIGVYIVGDEPTEEFKEWKDKKHLDHVHYVGFKAKKDLLEYYAASDIFVLMTRADVWGLVINEAMTFSLPIITTDMCVAGLELVENDKNGYIIPINKADVLSERIEYILNNEQIRKKFGDESLRRIQMYTIEDMAVIHIDILKQIYMLKKG